MLDSVKDNAYSSAVAGFTKLFSSLIFSTVWREELHIKVVWITMLAMANRHGDVLASVPGLADAARVSLKQCREALAKLSSPDPDSRSKESKGRRITEVDGGWRLVNYDKYRAIRDADERRIQTRLAVRRFRAKQKASALTVSRSKPSKPRKAQAEAEAEADAEKSTTSATPSQRETWLTPFGETWTRTYGGEPAYGELAKHLHPLLKGRAVGEVLDHWARYLAATKAKYVSAARFAQTYATWAPPPMSALQYQTADEADRKAGILP